MISVSRNRITVCEYDSSDLYDIEIYDGANDYQGYIKKEDIDNYIECLRKMLDEARHTHQDTVRTDDFIRSECRDLLSDYRGNWIMAGRIPYIINIIEEFKSENGFGGYNKEKILKEIDSMDLSRLHKLVQVIKRKEIANETSRN